MPSLRYCKCGKRADKVGGIPYLLPALVQFDLASDSGRLCRGCYKDVKTALDATRVDLEAQAAAPRTRGQHVAGDAAAAQLALLPAKAAAAVPRLHADARMARLIVPIDCPSPILSPSQTPWCSRSSAMGRLRGMSAD